MTTLREKVAEAIGDELQEILATLLRAGPEFVDDAAENIRFIVSNAAIATVFDAMLSDEVLDAMTHKVVWPMMTPSDNVVGPRMMNRARIKAAIAALTSDGAQTGESR